MAQPSWLDLQQQQDADLQASEFRPRSCTVPAHLENLPRKYRGIVKFVPHSDNEYVLVQIWEKGKVVFRKECKKSTVKVLGRRVSCRWSVFTMVGTQDKVPDTRTHRSVAIKMQLYYKY